MVLSRTLKLARLTAQSVTALIYIAVGTLKMPWCAFARAAKYRQHVRELESQHKFQYKEESAIEERRVDSQRLCWRWWTDNEIVVGQIITPQRDETGGIVDVLEPENEEYDERYSEVKWRVVAIKALSESRAMLRVVSSPVRKISVCRHDFIF